jgi:hypothetical protein
MPKAGSVTYLKRVTLAFLPVASQQGFLFEER